MKIKLKLEWKYVFLIILNLSLNICDLSCVFYMLYAYIYVYLLVYDTIFFKLMCLEDIIKYLLIRFGFVNNLKGNFDLENFLKIVQCY